MAERTEEKVKKRRASALRLWLEEAWEGWLKQVGIIIPCALGYVLYKFDLVSEPTAGVAAVLVIVIGAVSQATWPAWHLCLEKAPAVKALFITFVCVWVVSTYPAVRAAMPPKALAETRLALGHTTATLKLDHPGPYEITVGGGFKQRGMSDAEAIYHLKVEGGGVSDEVSGSLQRRLVRVRASRRGGTSTSLQAHTEEVHPLEHVRSGEVTVSTESLDEQLEGGLIVTLRPAGPKPLVFLLLGGLAFLVALGFDARLVDPRGKLKTYLAAAAGVTYVFMIAFPREARPHSMVRPAVGALVLAGLLGGLGGWLLGLVARVLAGPKLKKARR